MSKISNALLSLILVLLFSIEGFSEVQSLGASMLDKNKVSCNFKCITDKSTAADISVTTPKGKVSSVEDFLKRLLQKKQKRTAKLVLMNEIDQKSADAIIKKEKKKNKRFLSSYTKECKSAQENYLICNDLKEGACKVVNTDDNDDNVVNTDDRVIIGDLTIIAPKRYQRILPKAKSHLKIGRDAFGSTMIKIGLDWKNIINIPGHGRIELPDSTSFIVTGVGNSEDALEGKTASYEHLYSNPDGSRIDGLYIATEDSSPFYGTTMNPEGTSVKVRIRDGRIYIHFIFSLISDIYGPFSTEVIWNSPHICLPKFSEYKGSITHNNRCLTEDEYYCIIKDSCSLKRARVAKQDSEFISFSGAVYSSKTKNVNSARPNVCMKISTQDGESTNNKKKVLTAANGEYLFTLGASEIGLDDAGNKTTIVIEPAAEEEVLNPNKIELKDLRPEDMGKEYGELDFITKK